MDTQTSSNFIFKMTLQKRVRGLTEQQDTIFCTKSNINEKATPAKFKEEYKSLKK